MRRAARYILYIIRYLVFAAWPNVRQETGVIVKNRNRSETEQLNPRE